MEVILKKQKTIMEQVADAKFDAEVNKREIETIKLTRAETYQMANEIAETPYLKGLALGIGRKVLLEEKVEAFLLGVAVVYDPKEDKTTG